MSTSIQDLDELIATTKQHFTNNKEELDELRELEIYLADNEYEFEHLKEDLDEIKSSYISLRNDSNQNNKATNILDKITQIITGKPPSLKNSKKDTLNSVYDGLTIDRKYNKVEYFNSLV